MDFIPLQRRAQQGKRTKPSEEDGGADFDPAGKYSQRQKTESQRFLFMILGLTMVSLITLVFYWFNKFHVADVYWSSGGILKIFKHRTPVRVMHSPAVDWKVWTRGNQPGSGWTPEYLIQNSRRGAILNMTQASDDPNFLYYDKTKPFATDSKLLNWVPPVRNLINPTLQEFFDVVQLDKGRRYYYWSSQLDHLGPNIVRDIEPSAPFVFSKESKSVNLFLSSPGVIAHTHYDTYHNIYAQIHGKKTFYLFPPTAWTHLSLFPRLHPSHRQSQLNPISFMDDYEDIKSETGGYKIVLEPGDIIYVPPFWYHRVTTEEVSISINIWSDSEEMQIIDDILSRAVPFEADWTLDDRLVSVPRFLDYVIDGVKYKSPHIFSVGRCPAYRPGCRLTQDLLGSRYATLLSSGKFTALSNHAQISQFCRSYTWKEDSNLKDRASVFSWLFLQLPDGVRETALMDFVEEWSLWSVDYDVDSVPSFMDSCFGAFGDS